MVKEKKQKKKKALPPGVRERGGRYTYRYSVDVVVDGKKKRKQKETVSYSTAEEAFNAGILIKADQLRGKLVDEKTITLEKWGERWLENYILEKEPALYTIRNKKTVLKSLKKQMGSHTKLKDITGDDYQSWLNSLKKNGLEESTIKSYYATANIIFSDAVRRKIIIDNPTFGTNVPVFKKTLEQIEAGDSEIPKYLEKVELKHFLNYVRFRGNPQDYNIFVSLSYTGLRIGELLALKETDFNEEERYISVTKTLTVLNSVKNYKLGPPKNKSSIRKVTIGDTVIKAIKSQLTWRTQMKNDGKLLHDANFLFWSIKFPGFPGCIQAIEHRFSLLLNAAGINSPSLTPHSLRHTHTTLLAEAGEELAVIQDRLGHKNDDITKRIYLHVTKGQKKLVPDKFERVMNS